MCICHVIPHHGFDMDLAFPHHLRILVSVLALVLVSVLVSVLFYLSLGLGFGVSALVLVLEFQPQPQSSLSVSVPPLPRSWHCSWAVRAIHDASLCSYWLGIAAGPFASGQFRWGPRVEHPLPQTNSQPYCRLATAPYNPHHAKSKVVQFVSAERGQT